MSDSLKVHVVSLGCPKNLCDTEHLLADLKDSLAPLQFTSKKDEANLILVNTCAFIEEAVSESVECILELSNDKNKNQKLIVFGCLPLRYGRQLKELLPEVDLFIFHVEPREVAREIITAFGVKESILPHDPGRIITGNPWQVFVKISDGCSNRCTYCLIPKIRGKTRCKDPKSIVEEINGAVAQGAVEVTLVAQDLTSYHHQGTDLVGLIKEILRHTNIPWLRLMYLYPGGLNNELLELIASEDRICKYLDIPIQHASDKILKRMGRVNSSRKVIENSLERVRQFLPDASLRTTVMVGFPGENEEDFNELIDFIKKWKFHNLGCFAYSDEEDAASHALNGKIDKSVAEKRKETVLTIQRDISRAINTKYVGKELDVLVDGYCPESELLICGRTRFQAPGIDGLTYITKGLSRAGSLEKVLITEAHDYDLVGEIVDTKGH